MIGVAEQRIWLTDAYFMGTSTYIESLSAAAGSGVDVRLLLPNNSDVAWVGNASRTLYRRLLESGVRIFEWNGAMIHAKTAVADGLFVRIGSTNLNVSSWIGNWELDVAIEDESIGRQMEALYERDLANATEVVITDRHRVRLSESSATGGPINRARGRRPLSRTVGGSANRVMKDMTLAGSVLGSAVRGYRAVGPAEAAALAFFGAVALLLSRRGVLVASRARVAGCRAGDPGRAVAARARLARGCRQRAQLAIDSTSADCRRRPRGNSMPSVLIL